ALPAALPTWHAPAAREARARAVSDPERRPVLDAVRSRLDGLPEWEEEAIRTAIRDAGAEVGARGRALFLPVRLALTGEEHGPDLAGIAVVLGRARTLALLGADRGEV